MKVSQKILIFIWNCWGRNWFHYVNGKYMMTTRKPHFIWKSRSWFMFSTIKALESFSPSQPLDNIGVMHGVYWKGNTANTCIKRCNLLIDDFASGSGTKGRYWRYSRPLYWRENQAILLHLQTRYVFPQGLWWGQRIIPGQQASSWYKLSWLLCACSKASFVWSCWKEYSRCNAYYYYST